MSQLDDLIADFLSALERGEQPDRQAILSAHPELESELEEFFANHDEIFGSVNEPQSSAEPDKRDIGEDATTVGPANSKDPTTTGEKNLDGSNPKLIGNYLILEEIDRGGMGIVYRALDQDLQRVVAVKMIRSGRLASESYVQRFKAEARAAAKLDHPGIVSVHEVGTHEGQPYFSMAFIEGQNLAGYLKENELTVEESCLLIKEIAEAIDHAHENGLVHRDLKPANILMDRKNRAKITDFGLAKSLDQDDGITGTGEILGTINFMAPEQAAAKNDQIDRMTDVYSLGAMLYFLCTGQPPFETDNPVDTLLRILDSEPVLANKINPKVPRDVAVICMRCLEKDPQNRYQTASELVEELDRFLKGEPVEASHSSLVSRFRKWSRREPSLVGHLVGLGLIEFTRACNYGYQAFVNGEDLDQYMKFSIPILAWAVVCVVLQQLQNRFRGLEQLIKFGWAVTDIGFLTAILLMAGGALGPLYIAYPLVIVMSGFFNRVRLVTFTTALCIVSFVIVFVNHPVESEFKHYGIVGLAAIIAIGYVMSLLVYRIRLLNRLFE